MYVCMYVTLRTENSKVDTHDCRLSNSLRSFEAPSTHTYPDICDSATFSLSIKKFHVHTYPTLIWIHSSTQDSSGNIGNRACVEVAILNTGLDLVTSPDNKK